MCTVRVYHIVTYSYTGYSRYRSGGDASSFVYRICKDIHVLYYCNLAYFILTIYSIFKTVYDLDLKLNSRADIMSQFRWTSLVGDDNR